MIFNCTSVPGGFLQSPWIGRTRPPAVARETIVITRPCDSGIFAVLQRPHDLSSQFVITTGVPTGRSHGVLFRRRHAARKAAGKQEAGKSWAGRILTKVPDQVPDQRAPSRSGTNLATASCMIDG
jgi:hypothetical protein